MSIKRLGSAKRLFQLIAGLSVTTIPSSFAAERASASPIIFKTSTIRASLNGSKYRHVGAFNVALATALKSCGKLVPTGVVNDAGRVGPTTARGIRELRTCPGWGIAGEEGSGDVTEALWSRILPDIPVPDGFARLFAVTLTLEGTDYDVFQWNYSSIDPTAWGTWGPFGATIGQDGEIQQILKAAEEADPNVVRDAFSRAAQETGSAGRVQDPKERAKICSTAKSGPRDDYALYQEVLTLRKAAAGQAMRVAFCDDTRFSIWVRAFRILGAQPVVRRAYDALYLSSDKKVARYISRVRDAYGRAGGTATEIDIALGVDGQTQLSARADVTRIGQVLSRLGANATPAQRRLAISKSLPVRNGSMWDRCGRDQVFIRGIGGPLSPQPVCSGVFAAGKRKGERWDANSAWLGRAHFVAEEAGLRDVNGGDIAARWNFDFDQGPRPR